MPTNDNLIEKIRKRMETFILNDDLHGMKDLYEKLQECQDTLRLDIEELEYFNKRENEDD